MSSSRAWANAAVCLNGRGPVFPKPSLFPCDFTLAHRLFSIAPASAKAARAAPAAHFDRLAQQVEL